MSSLSNPKLIFKKKNNQLNHNENNLLPNTLPSNEIIKIILESRNNTEMKKKFNNLSQSTHTIITNQVILATKEKIKSNPNSLLNVVKKIKLSKLNANNLVQIIREIYSDEGENEKKEIIRNISNILRNKNREENLEEESKAIERHENFPNTGKFSQPL